MGNRSSVLVAALVLLFATATATAQVVDKGAQASAIEIECGLKKGTITVDGGQVHLRPSPDEDYKAVDCALARLKGAKLGNLGFVGNEADPNAVVKPPLHYIAGGSSAEIDALVKAARQDKWIINKTAKASDGTIMVDFQTGPNMTHGQADGLVERIWKHEFGDLEFGYAPRRLSAPEPYDD